MIQPFVDLTWLSDHPEAVVADVRFYLDGRSTRDAYFAGHLPGAVYIDVHHGLAGTPTDATGRHPLPDPDAFAATMSEAGIGDADVVVAYDDAGGVIAARLVWMLRVLGRDAAVLDGGLQAWSGALETTEDARPPAEFTARPWPVGNLASIDDAQDPRNVVVDARPYDRYLGGRDDVDPRFGHIPGARSLPVREHNGADGRLLPDAVLRERLAAVGIDGTTPVVSYCGSGVTACHSLLVMEQVGLPAGRLYPGSWSQYSHTERPIETGDPFASA